MAGRSACAVRAGGSALAKLETNCVPDLCSSWLHAPHNPTELRSILRARRAPGRQRHVAAPLNVCHRCIIPSVPESPQSNLAYYFHRSPRHPIYVLRGPTCQSRDGARTPHGRPWTSSFHAALLLLDHGRSMGVAPADVEGLDEKPTEGIRVLGVPAREPARARLSRLAVEKLLAKSRSLTPTGVFTRVGRKVESLKLDQDAEAVMARWGSEGGTNGAQRQPLLWGPCKARGLRKRRRAGDGDSHWFNTRSCAQASE